MRAISEFRVVGPIPISRLSQTDGPAISKADDLPLFVHRTDLKLTKPQCTVGQRRVRTLTNRLSEGSRGFAGDLLTDLSAMLAGSLGMLPSASLGSGKLGLYEPIHGSAPDIAGNGLANPLATILSVALLLRHSLDLEAEARAVESAVEQVLDRGLRTPDTAAPGQPALLTGEMGDAVVQGLEARQPAVVASPARS